MIFATIAPRDPKQRGTLMPEGAQGVRRWRASNLVSRPRTDFNFNECHINWGTTGEDEAYLTNAYRWKENLTIVTSQGGVVCRARYIVIDEKHRLNGRVAPISFNPLRVAA